MRKLLPVLVALFVFGSAPLAFGASGEVNSMNDTSAVRVKGTTDGGLATQAGLPGRRPTEEGKSLGGQVGQYFLNRWFDLIDIVDFSIGAGPGFLINARVTKLVQLVGGVSDSWRVGFRGRRAGVWREKRKECGFSLLYYQKVQREKITGWVESFRVDEMDLDTADVYGGDKDRSFWGVGATVHAGILVDINVRPMQVADFVLGLLTVDVLEDDTGRPYRNKDL
jgi:hypothetical protein